MDELGTTRFARGTRSFLLSLFLAIVVLVPVIDTAGDYLDNAAQQRRMLAAHAPISEIPRRRPQAFDVIDFVPTPSRILGARTLEDWTRLLPTPRVLREYEDERSRRSRVGKWVRPWAQWLLTGWFGTGNQQVVYGKDGWLFYSEGAQYASGPGFLDPAQLDKRKGEVPAPDPRPAIYQLNDELKAIGTTLIVLPVPEKAVVHPSSFSTGRVFDGPVQNPSWGEFLQGLRQHGVLTLDLSQSMFDAERSGSPQFLQADTHWSESGLDLTARALASALAEQPGVSSAPSRVFVRRPIRFVRKFDLLTRLDLPDFAAKRLTSLAPIGLTQIRDASGTTWRPDTTSGILFIGDSFLEIFSDGTGSGLAAGLAEQVSFYLQRAVDRRAKHDFGFLDVREQLGTSIEMVRREAARRRIIVFVFAMRKLSANGWPLLE